MANKDVAKPEEAPNTHATYERSEDQTTTQKKGEASDGKRSTPLPAGGEIKGNMKTEEPTGWDQAPQDIDDPEKKRHPRVDGVGGSEENSAKRLKKSS